MSRTKPLKLPRRRSLRDPELPLMNVRTWTPPTLPGFQFLMACRARLHPYIRTFAAARAAVPDGIGWLVPIRFFALEVLRTFWV